jgi:hypothetical protein
MYDLSTLMYDLSTPGRGIPAVAQGSAFSWVAEECLDAGAQP